MTVKTGDIIARFPKLLRIISGDEQTAISKPCSPDAAEADCILFLGDRGLVEAASSGPASTIVVDESLAQDPSLEAVKQTVLLSPNVELAMALVCQTFFPILVTKQGFDDVSIHPSAVISETATVGDGTIVGPSAVIAANTRIGASCIIGGNTHIEADVVVGDGCHIHPQVFIAHGTMIGKNCEIHPQSSLGTEGYGYAHDEQFNHYRHVHYGRLIVEDDVHIGSGVFIDRGRFGDSVIGRGTKIDNYCHLAHNIKVGRNCLITGGFAAAGSVTIGDSNVFGGRANVTDHVTIGNNMQFAGGSAVMKDIDVPGGRFGGYPLQPVNEFLRATACIPHLPQIRKNVDQLMQKLGLK